MEIIIAMAMIVTSISTVILVVFTSQYVSVDSELANGAIYKSGEQLEIARAAARGNFDSVSSTSSIDGVYTKELVVSGLDAYRKKMISRVSWTDELSRTKKVELTTIISDWTAVSPDDGTGPGSGLSGDWENPITLGQIDIGPGNAGTDVAIKSDAVFLTSIASDSKKPDLYSISVTNPQIPAKLSSINTGFGLNSVSVTGDYAYTAHNHESSQLQIIRISNPSQMSLTKSQDMQSMREEGLSTFSLGHYVYMGSEKYDRGDEFQIFDVLDPSSPQFVGSYKVDDDVNDIYVLKNRAYLATSGNHKEILVFDISNPSSPNLISTYDNPGDENGLSVFALDENTIFAGIGRHLSIIDISNPNSPVLKGTYDAGGDVNDLYVEEYLAFLATSNSNKEFQAINISDQSHPQLYSFYNFPQNATGIIYRNNVVYISVKSNDALRIITSR